jgi:arylsulfatase A-like enzyme
VYAGASYFHVRPGDSRVPDLFAVVQHGVVYTGGTKKIAEHGGAAPQDRDVPLVVSGPRSPHAVVASPVSTIQIAPTTLRLLGLDPWSLRAAAMDRTLPLPLALPLS